MDFTTQAEKQYKDGSILSKTGEEGFKMDTASLEMRVLSIRRASEIAKQIFRRTEAYQGASVDILRAVQDATHDIDQNNLDGTNLTDASTISQILSLPEQVVESSLLKLSGYNDENPDPLIAIFPLLSLSDDQIVTPRTKFVFARPTFQDTNKLKKYMEAIAKNNLMIMKQWAMIRPHLECDEQRVKLKTMISHNSSTVTLIQRNITDFFIVPQLLAGSNTREFIYHNFVKPIMKKLISEEILLYVEISFQDQNINGMYWSRDDELFIWYEVLVELCNVNDNLSWIDFDVEIPKRVVSKLESLNWDSLTKTQQKVIQELYLLCHVIPHRKISAKKVSDEKATKDYARVVQFLSQCFKVIERSAMEVKPDILDKVENSRQIIFKKYIHKKEIQSYYLHKERIKNALHSAKREWEHYRADLQIKVLSAMEIHNYLNREEIKEFKELEGMVMFGTLPWYIRFYRILRNWRVLKPQELKELKEARAIALENQIGKIERDIQKKLIRKSVINQQKKDIVEMDSSLKENTDLESEDKNEEKEHLLEDLGGTEIENNIETKKQIKEIIQIIDNAWDKKEYPNRNYLLEQVSGFDKEDKLIKFVKDHCSNKLMSFYIKIEKPEYSFPILITRQYVSKNGKKILEEIKNHIEKLKASPVPDQQAYDLYLSIETFLNKVFTKLRI